jgi:hypothetical protein
MKVPALWAGPDEILPHRPITRQRIFARPARLPIEQTGQWAKIPIESGLESRYHVPAEIVNILP